MQRDNILVSFFSCCKNIKPAGDFVSGGKWRSKVEEIEGHSSRRLSLLSHIPLFCSALYKPSDMYSLAFSRGCTQHDYHPQCILVVAVYPANWYSGMSIGSSYRQHVNKIHKNYQRQGQLWLKRFILWDGKEFNHKRLASWTISRMINVNWGGYCRCLDSFLSPALLSSPSRMLTVADTASAKKDSQLLHDIVSAHQKLIPAISRNYTYCGGCFQK